MTPASSDRYQSRLFRFVYKQSRRFTQQCDRAFRNLKSTASWVTAVGLYPLFLLLQSRRSTANQVHQAVEATLRQLPTDDKDTLEASPTVDTPIRQVLLYVTGAAESQESKVKSQNLLTTPLTPSSARGIASQLSNRSLVLVTAQNQTLDIIDPQQQAALQDEIITAIAQYWQYRQRQNQSLAPSVWLTSLDRTVAEVESHHLVRVKSAAIAFYHRMNLSRTNRPAAGVQSEDSRKTHTTKVLSLIWAAIDYFFGTDDRATIPPVATGTSRNRSPHLIGRAIAANPQFRPTRSPARLSASNLADEELEDPWLTASDLFGSDAGEEMGDRSIPAVSAKDDPPNPTFQGGQQSTLQDSRLQNRANKRISPSKSQRRIEGIAGTNSTTDKISKSTTEDTSVQSTPDWIETRATLMGYVKHPLEQILAWLDRAMLWLEETLLKFWQWLQKMWRKL